MSVLTHKGYKARVEFDPEDEVFVGRLAGINDVVGFHADSVDGLKAAFREAVEDYVAVCRKAGKTPEKPYSGNLMVRVAPEVHASAVLSAQLAGKSLNQWAEEVLQEASVQGADRRAKGTHLGGALKTATKAKPAAKRARRATPKDDAPALKRA